MRKALACLLAVAAVMLVPSVATASSPSVPPWERFEEVKAQRNAAGERVVEVEAAHATAVEQYAVVADLADQIGAELAAIDERLDTTKQRLGVLGQISAGVSHGMLTGILTDVFGSPSEAQRVELTATRSELARTLDEVQKKLAEHGKLRDQLAADLAEAKEAHGTLAKRAKTIRNLRPEIKEVESGLVEVGGIVVDRRLGKSLQALLWHAHADGLNLGGYGYRSTERQIELRRQNGCPNVYKSSPSSCRIPTALPGTSMHETGLAIDFTIDGDTICFPRSAARCPASNPAFSWLVTHAGNYGLKNLPSEAWHWSTTGR